ncbi:MAG: sugar phosphate nucleotidyltransferase [Candidatus Gorgyraea atricola]|nr:sugar phosphate nucleotidyltransferase [Candidatus Gorgyraea atricola]
MKLVILCGGRGTRIRDVSEVLPKAMLPIGDRPMIWHIMKMYAHYGIKDFVLCLGYKGWLIKEFFLNYMAKVSDVTVNLNKKGLAVYRHHRNEDLDWKVTMVETGENSQTGARIWNVRKYLEHSNIFGVTYADGVADIDIKELIETHKKSSLLGTITGVYPASRFGEIQATGNMISSFNEKPNVSTGLFNGGFMVFNKKVIHKYFRPGEDLVLEGETLPNMVKDKQMGVYEHKGFWYCVDTIREYGNLNQMWKENRAPWKVWE